MARGIRRTARKQHAAEVQKYLQAHSVRLQWEEMELYARLVDDFQRDSLKLLTPAQRRKAHKALLSTINEWRAGNLAADGDGRKWSKRKKIARARCVQLLMKYFPNYRKWIALRAAFQRNFAAIIWKDFKSRTAAQVPIGWTIALPNPPTQLTSFTAPFPLQQLTLADFENEGFIQHNRNSSVESGLLIHDMEFDDDEHTRFLGGLPGWNHVQAIVMCGVDYTMPRSGRLYITAEMQNLHSHGVLSVRDNFGLSSAVIKASLNLHMMIVRPSGELVEMTKILFTETLISDGDDEQTFIPELEPLYRWDRSSPIAFEQDEELQIYVGAMLNVNCVLNDMHGHVRILVASVLKNISVGVQ